MGGIPVFTSRIDPMAYKTLSGVLYLQLLDLSGEPFPQQLILRGWNETKIFSRCSEHDIQYENGEDRLWLYNSLERIRSWVDGHRTQNRFIFVNQPLELLLEGS